MKAYSNKSNFQIEVIGDTGYANNSYLHITMTDLGILRVDKSNWDLSDLDLSKITRIELSIPSGEFDLRVSSYTAENGSITFAGCGDWNGKQAGLAGMSGYGEFWMESEVEVLSGLFHYYKEGFTKMNPTIQEYNCIRDRSRALKGSDWEAILLEERTVAEVENIPDYWKQWIDYLQTDEAIQKELELAHQNDL